jgi:hypothetical protein
MAAFSRVEMQRGEAAAGFGEPQGAPGRRKHREETAEDTEDAETDGTTDGHRFTQIASREGRRDALK